MYPTIYHFIKDLLGIEICFAKALQTFGFFVVMAFVSAFWFVVSEFKRKEKQGIFKALQVKSPALNTSIDYIGILIWFFFGYKFGALIVDTTCTLADDIRGFLFSAQGNIITGILGAFLGFYFSWREVQKNKTLTPKQTHTEHPFEWVGTGFFIAAGFGILGAKIFHLLENPDEIAGMFSSIDSFFSGLTMYGGLVIGGAAVLIYFKKKNIPLLDLCDASMPQLLLGYGVGRLGCQFSGDGDWGIVNTLPKPESLSFLPDWAWSFQYPHNVINAGERIAGCVGDFCHQLPQAVYPTPLYESVFSIVAFFVLWSFRKKIKLTGVMTCLYLMVNGFERFWIEKIRVNTEYPILGGITQAEIISTLLFLGGLIGLIYILRHKEKFRQPELSTASN